MGKHSTEWTHRDIFSGLTFERLPPRSPFGAHGDIFSHSCPVLTPHPMLSSPVFRGTGPTLVPGGHVTRPTRTNETQFQDFCWDCWGRKILPTGCLEKVKLGKSVVTGSHLPPKCFPGTKLTHSKGSRSS